MKHAIKKLWVILLALALLLVAGCQEPKSPAATPTVSVDVPQSPSITEAGRLVALGTILPAQTVQLRFLTSGQVRAVLGQVGMEVKAGDLLAELDTTDLDLAVQAAADELALQEAQLEQALAGARVQEVAMAAEAYQQALAQHEGLLAGAPPQRLAVAQAEFEAARARYERVNRGEHEEDLVAARIQVEKAEAALRKCQADYDAIAWQPDVAASAQALALHEATLDFQAAQAEFARLQNLPSEADLKEAAAQLAVAEAQLVLAQTGPSIHDVAASSHGLNIARAQLELVEAEPRPEDVAVAQARLQQARTALERARLPLSRCRLRAPFDGIVSAIFLSPGEWAQPDVPVVELLDTTRWRVETRNVGELNIGRVRVGHEAAVRVIAFRDRVLEGRIAAISPVAVVQQGDTTYTLIVELDPVELPLRPGMNAEVEIAVEP